MMTPLPYINPCLLPGLHTSTGIEPGLLRKAQKELMAEFELNETALISLGNQQLSKSEVLALFDSLQDEKIRAFHQRLNEMPTLLAFLEKGNLAFFQEKNYQEFLSAVKSDADFSRFLAPFYAFQFDALFLQYISRRDEDELKSMLSQPLWLELGEQSACYAGADRYLQRQLEGLRQLASSIEHGNKAPGPEVQEAVDENWIHILNLLPAAFDGLIQAYAKALEKLALGLFNTYQRGKLAKYVLRQGMKLRLNTETASRLQYVLDQLENMVPDDSFGLEDIQQALETPKKGVKFWQLALGGLVAYLVLKVLF